MPWRNKEQTAYIPLFNRNQLKLINCRIQNYSLNAQGETQWKYLTIR